MLAENLQAEIEERYGLMLGEGSQIINGGDESDIFHFGSIIVRVSPKWRSLNELNWVHGILRHCAKSIPEAVAPIVDKHGETVFIHEDYPISVFPFCAGKPLDAADDLAVENAARLLCRVHQALANWQGDIERPSSNGSKPIPLAPDAYPPELIDPELDRWHANLNLSQQIIHGDFYERNILCEGSKIIGLIDWDECYYNYLMAEIGWTAWEMCQYPDEDDIDEAKTKTFLAAYLSGNPPLPKEELIHTIPFIRWRLRSEALVSLAEAARTGNYWDMEYTEREIRVFQRLKGRILTV
jgi:Ser/Thr protein kinase RdoA (MazF antagonist)